MLPRVVARRNGRGVPWVSVLLCGLAWALALKLPFEKLISIDLILYGTSLLLEFVALVVLRLREPNLERPFKAGNLAFAVSLGVGPAALIGYALYATRNEKIMGSTSALLRDSSWRSVIADTDWIPAQEGSWPGWNWRSCCQGS